jgi:hypothetical protein
VYGHHHVGHAVVQLAAYPLLLQGSGARRSFADAAPLAFFLVEPPVRDVLMGDHHPRWCPLLREERYTPDEPAPRLARVARVLQLEGPLPAAQHVPHPRRERGGPSELGPVAAPHTSR